MLTTVAALIILLGLMASLARYVRNASAVDVTKRLLRSLDGLMLQYMQHHDGKVPMVTPLLAETGIADERLLLKAATANNRDVVAALKGETGIAGTSAFGGLPDSIYNEATLRDAWGSPIVFMPSMHREIGIAPNNRPFFFSAGPDRRYLTQDDNLYSYEENGKDEVAPK